MPTITITAYRRPHLLQATLSTLIANDLAGWRILIGIEPSPFTDEVVGVTKKMLHGYDFAAKVNETRHGIKENPFRLIESAFAEGAELILYLEEDLGPLGP